MSSKPRAAESNNTAHGQSSDPLDTIFTLPNLITFLRFLLIPFFVFLLIRGHRTEAFAVFLIAGSTDWIDGLVARSTNSVSRFGKIFDPLIDRLLLATGVISVFALGEVPFWPLVIIIVRDVILVLGAQELHKRWNGATIPVMFAGKVTTAMLLIGFGSLLLDWPMVPGLGILESPLLPGFGTGAHPIGVFCVYIGVVFSVVTGCIYFKRGFALDRENKRKLRQNAEL